ncbi:bifunctional 4-hydroxy-2-oxoglutarate aldolase/2-dehydro-3-deoxy-phosphogluconate aldolase [Erysipelotrichaceae bacterium OH741_COT-311]|nr:bifunctional 4-hydroxy-2-oxoglutarate aldolase/2-dehydro-3-deoxy-phosphogluconate aldolase [Erysipelotrichaceae bacterium OH741_COT-311]
MKKYKLAPITIIMRGYDMDSAICIAKKLNQYTCFGIEVTMNTPNALEIIKKLVSLNLKRVKVGAGTVITMEELVQVVQAGASFVLSPITMSAEMLKYCKDHQVISVPGAFSPSEIYHMKVLGADIIKIFPVSSFHLSYYKSIKAPLGDMDFMAVGGVDVDNAKNYFDSGCKYIGIGSSLCKLSDILKQDYTELEEHLERLSQLV